MRHRVKGKHLKRTSDNRRQLRMALATALLQHERIETTLAKAQFVRDDVEKMVTTAKNGLASSDPADGVHARRLVASQLNNNRALVTKLFDTIAPRYASRQGGYTRIYKLGPRKGDNAEMVLLELVDRTVES
ncbi:MAG: 50S ribosomal protein L17 [Chloroflexi bacterium OLB15]|nr:MAG: 50S ribosomal protein L17 [Chloroflexi bacterium OLB15]